MNGCAEQPERPSQPPNVITVERPVTVYEKCPVTLPTPPKGCEVVRDATRVVWLRCRLANDERVGAYMKELETQLRLCAN